MFPFFFDTETTGVPNRSLPMDHPSQPRICQVALVVTDPEGRIKQKAKFLIRPHGAWTIPAEVTAIHGLTTEECQQYGINIKGALLLLKRYVQTASVIVGHNIRFDEYMLKREAIADGQNPDDYAFKNIFCTMAETKDLAAMAPTDKMMAAGIRDHKAPKLHQIYEILFGEPLHGAHDALQDVLACRQIYYRVQRLRREAQAAVQ